MIGGVRSSPLIGCCWSRAGPRCCGRCGGTSSTSACCCCSTRSRCSPTIYTISTHYLHTIYTLSTHYLHTIYTVSTHYLHISTHYLHRDGKSTCRKSRSRACNNPVPSNGGADCAGSSQEAGDCGASGGWITITLNNDQIILIIHQNIMLLPIIAQC